jgi:hypothetical protein
MRTLRKQRRAVFAAFAIAYVEHARREMDVLYPRRYALTDAQPSPLDELSHQSSRTCHVLQDGFNFVGE